MRSLTSFGMTFIVKRKDEGRRNFALQNFFFPHFHCPPNLVIPTVAIAKGGICL